MKVLIVAGSRVGGTKIGEWLGYELGIEYIHEPFAHWRDGFGIRDGYKKIRDREDLIVKVFPGIELDTITKENGEWDTIIGLRRENVRECSESIVMAEETNVWHKEYVIDTQWLKDKEVSINEAILRVSEWNERILNDNRIELQISYEGIFNSKGDRDKLKALLGIKEWRFESMLDTEYRYRKEKMDTNKTKLI
jgi:hypothetical protein